MYHYIYSVKYLSIYNNDADKKNENFESSDKKIKKLKVQIKMLIIW